MPGFRPRPRHARRPWIVGGVLLVASGFAAHATRASLDQIEQETPSAAPDASADAARLLPGSAPARGVTGTVDLPALPPGASMASLTEADPSVLPARPFVLRGTATDAVRATECLTTAIYYEAASESDDGQRAVAQVILNRVRHSVFPATICGVIYQGSDRRGCQFSYACDGSMARRPQLAAWARARRIALDALYGRVFAPVGLATHYHTYAVTPSWNRSLVMTGVQGAHFFHRWKGWWGTPEAFQDRYRGGEPMPGPLRAVVQPLPEPVLAAAAVPTPVAAALVTADLSLALPRHAASGQMIDSAAAGTEGVQVAAPGDDLPPASAILDKWKDSGKPIR